MIFQFLIFEPQNINSTLIQEKSPLSIFFFLDGIIMHCTIKFNTQPELRTIEV